MCAALHTPITSSCGKSVKKSPTLPLMLSDNRDRFCRYSSASSCPSATLRTLLDPKQNLHG